MFSLINKITLPLLHGFDPETAHGLALKALKVLPPFPSCNDDPLLKVRAFGLNFTNPLGLAAGLDKNGLCPEQFLQLGFGFVEMGTVTPLPQQGNPKPRLFRLSEDEGVVNRLGFNNAGHAAVYQNLNGKKGLIGVNIGANKDALDRIADYVAGIKRFASLARYFTVNISSPNTPGLRDLQNAKALDELLARVMDAQNNHCPHIPVLLKIAPDLHLNDLDDVVSIAINRKINGLIISNTTISRPDTLKSPNKNEMGGLSGKPLFDLSTRMLAETYIRIEEKMPLIGVGGINNAASAIEKIRAGATLIQLYSAFVYKGLPLVNEIKKGLITHLKSSEKSLLQLTGEGVNDWRLCAHSSPP